MSFLEKSTPPYLDFATFYNVKIQVQDVKFFLLKCASLLKDVWLDIPCVLLPCSFCSNLKWLATKIPEGTISQIFPQSHFTKSFYSFQKVGRLKIFLFSFFQQANFNRKEKESGYLPRVLIFKTQACLWETFKLHLMLVKWFPLQLQHLRTYPQDQKPLRDLQNL